MITKNKEIQNAFLLFIDIQSFINTNKFDNEFDEFQSLAVSAGLSVKDKLIHSQKIPLINTFVSKGKLNLIKNMLRDKDIELVVINHKLSATQTRNLEKFFNKRVIDKTELILDIFASRA